MVLDIIKNRHSVRKYSDKKIPKEIIIEILEAGRLAPSWVNSQPWHFLVVEDKEKKQLLSKFAMGQKQVAMASHLIVMLADLNAWNEENYSNTLKLRPEMDEQSIENIIKSPILNPSLLGPQITLLRTVEQCTYALAYMTLQAEALNVNSCIIGAISNELVSNDVDIISQIKSCFNIPDGVFISSILALGYKEDYELKSKSPKKIRKDFNNIVSFNSFGNKF